MMYARTEAQCADIFIKNFRDVLKWQKAVQDIGVGPKGGDPMMPPTPGPRPPKEESTEGKVDGGSSSLDQSPKPTKKRAVKKPKAKTKVDIKNAVLE